MLSETAEETVYIFKKPAQHSCGENKIYVGRQTLAGGSLLRSGQTQVGEPKIVEHAQ
jgi:hypothetical protein